MKEPKQGQHVFQITHFGRRLIIYIASFVSVTELIPFPNVEVKGQ